MDVGALTYQGQFADAVMLGLRSPLFRELRL